MKQAGDHTSFNPIDDRFEYSRKGIFRCKYKKEAMYVALFIGGVFLINFIVILLAAVTEPPSLAWLVFGVVEWVVPLLSPFILIGGVRTLLSGAYYKFTVNDEKMLIVCPRENYRADIYFGNVKGVEYNDIFRFGRKKGYHVNVICNDSTYTYDFLYPQGVQNMGEDLTPFRIIEERCGFIARPEYYGGQRIDEYIK